MGTLLSANKGGCFWQLVGYLADANVFVKDSRLVPYTPSELQTYVGFFPWYAPGTLMTVVVNGQRQAVAAVVDFTGLLYANVAVPQGAFSLQIVDPHGVVAANEAYVATNYAMLLGVSAQQREDRLNDIAVVGGDQWFQSCRSSRLYDVVGAYFGFQPPPGWTPQQYRAALIGDGATKPGFTEAFWFGGTKKGVGDVVASITGQQPVFSQVQGGVLWTVGDVLNDADVLQWVIPDAVDEIVSAPYAMPTLYGEDYLDSVAVVTVPGSLVGVPAESVLKRTNSFLQSETNTMSLDGMSLTFAISSQKTGITSTYTTTFPVPTASAAAAAAAILAQNPALTPAVYATAGGYLRLGVSPRSGDVVVVTILSGSALSALGWTAGQSVAVATDFLSNQDLLPGSLTLTFGATTFTAGTDYAVNTATGEIVWNPSTATQTDIPPQGSVLTASYSYYMSREIEAVVALVAQAVDGFEFVWQ